MKKTKMLMAILFLSIGIAGCDIPAKSVSQEEKFPEIEKKLTASVGELTKIPTRVEIAAEPYIKGKIAVFHELKSNPKSIQALEKLNPKGNPVPKDKSYYLVTNDFREMEEIYAAAPEEVGTVALVDCRKLQKGVYTTDDGREFPAEVEDCELTLIDRSKQAVIFKKMFEKEASDTRRVYANSTITQSASLDITNFLKGLPRK